MTRIETFRRAARRGIAIGASALAVVAATSLGALAGECPEGQMKADAMKPGATMPEGVTDTVLGAIDMAGYKLPGAMFRLRRLVVQPGGVVPWHSHEVRPANIYIVEGSITEYRANCAVPIEHKTGDIAVESGADHAHWWKNNTTKPVVLISADILPAAMSSESTM